MTKLQSTLEPVDEKVEIEKATYDVPTSSAVEAHLEAIIQQVGPFGRYQVINYLLLCLPIICNAFYTNSYVFTASKVPHRCLISQCDHSGSNYDTQWLNFTIPRQNGQWAECNHYAFKTVRGVRGNSCLPRYFKRDELVRCESGYVSGDDHLTISNEFGIFCDDQWQLSMVGTINNFGQIVGIPLGGYISDHYGRKTLLVVSGVLSALAGLAQSHAANYFIFLCFEFIVMLIGSSLYLTAFVLAVELVSPNWRVIAAGGICLAYGLAEGALGYLADNIRDWRVLLRVLYTPALMHLVFICLLSESVRWLLSQSLELQAKSALHKMARVNRCALSVPMLRDLMRTNRDFLANTLSVSRHYTIRQIKDSLGWRIARCCFMWFSSALIDVGLSVNAISLSTNKYENFSIMGFMQPGGIILASLLIDRIGRRRSLCLGMGSCALFLVTAAAIGEISQVSSTIFYFLAKITSTGNLLILYFLTSEIFPTNCRNTILSFCSVTGRIGSMLAQQMLILSDSYQYGPHFLLATLAILAALLSFLFPETANKGLPSTLDDARALDIAMPISLPAAKDTNLDTYLRKFTK